MAALFQIAYLAAFGLWIPLAILAVLRPAVRRRVVVPLVASAIAAAYEAYMSLVLSSQSIRVDVFFVLFALGAIDAISGLNLLARARGQADRKLLQTAGTLCLAVPALAIAGFVAMSMEIGGIDRNLDLARRFRFEAYFRDDETEKRVFGVLEPDENPFAGYYAYAGEGDDRYAHLVINDEGRFWIYHSLLHEWQGTGSPTATGTFEGVGEGRMDTRNRIALRRQEGASFLLEVRHAAIPQPPRPALMRKADPPRFPRPPSASDEVRFAGVFSATYGEKNGAFWLSQVWLWESAGEWWGQYLRDHYTRGAEREFISTEKIVPACSEQCKVLSFETSRGAVRLTRVSTGEFTTTVGSPPEQVTLKRAETLPGFFLDLAPVATKAENRRWLEAMTTAGMITWKVPPNDGRVTSHPR